MFKKAEKNELKTWLLGIIILLVIFLFASIICVGSLISEFKTGYLVFSIIFALATFLFAMLLIKCFKAYKSFDERQAKALEEKRLEEENQKIEKEKKLEEEAREMAELRKQEEELRKANMEEIEKMRKEAGNEKDADLED